jgi:hypothetical protein
MVRIASIAFLLISTQGLFSQSGTIANLPRDYTKADKGGIHGDIRTGLGFATIGGDPHLAISFSPEFQIGELSAAFDLELYFHDSLRLRDDMYDSDPGYLRIIRHIYWGDPSDAFHTGVGTLYNINFGSGLLLSNYTNASNWDERDFGFLIDLNFPSVSIEAFTENILDPEIMGGRLGLAPLYNINVPILNTWQVGVTAVQDSSPDPRLHSGRNDSLDALAFDTSLSPLKSNNFLWTVFGQHAFYDNYGSASSLGSTFTIPGITSFLDLELQYEARFIDQQFIPGLFNANYELNRRRTGIHNLLSTAPDGTNHFIQARASIYKKLHLLANYSSPLDTAGQGIFSFEANAPDIFSPIALSAAFIKTHMDEFGDITDLDEHAQIRAVADWQLTKLFYMSLLYRVHWVEEQPNTYEKQETVRPQLTFRYSF